MIGQQLYSTSLYKTSVMIIHNHMCVRFQKLFQLTHQSVLKPQPGTSITIQHKQCIFRIHTDKIFQHKHTEYTEEHKQVKNKNLLANPIL